MRILYVAGSPQSGVIASLAAAIERQGSACTPLNVVPHFYPRYRRAPLPLPWPANLWNLFLARRQFGASHRYNFRKTDFAFDFMSRQARAAIRARSRDFDLVLQAGALFSGAGAPSHLPYCLYIDHTHAITQRYPPIAGLADPPPISPGWRERERRAYADAAHVFTMSRFVAASLGEDYGIDSARISVVGAGPNLAALPAIERAPSAQPTLLFVGKEHVRKGLPTLLEAFAFVRRQLPNARLVLVGVPAEIRGDGIDNRGRVESAAMPAHFAAADVFVMPTLREPFGLVFLEAMAFGLPCIGTAVEAIPEIIADGDTGFLVPPNDPAALAERILAVLGDPACARRLGAAGRQKVETDFTWDHVATRMLAVMERLLS